MSENTPQDTALQKREAEAQAAERTHTRPTYVPLADICEREDAVLITLDMPGADEKTLDIRYENQVLTIRAEAESQEEKDLTLVYSEYGVGDYERAFTLADTIDIDKAEAAYTNGVLKLTLPKAEGAKPKRIAVNAA